MFSKHYLGKRFTTQQLNMFAGFGEHENQQTYYRSFCVVEFTQ